MAAADSLKCFCIGNRTDSAGTTVPDTDQEEMRSVLAAMSGPGMTPNLLTGAVNANCFRVRQNTGSDMNVKVGSGTSKVDGYILRGGVAGQANYLARLDATTVTLSVPATDPTNPARYGVYLFVDDVGYSGTSGRRRLGLQCIRGTPAGSPTTPGPLSQWSASALLWEWQLAANATAVTNTILDTGGSTSTDDRHPAMPSMGAGGIIAQNVLTNSILNGYGGHPNNAIPNAAVTFWADPLRWYKYHFEALLSYNVGDTPLLTLSIPTGTNRRRWTITDTAQSVAHCVMEATVSGLSGLTTTAIGTISTNSMSIGDSGIGASGQSILTYVEDMGIGPR